MIRNLSFIPLAAFFAACGGGSGSAGGGQQAPPPTVVATVPVSATGCITKSAPSAAGAQSAPAGLHVPAHFIIQTIANVPGARELAALPNGDLLVGSQGDTYFIVRAAQHASGSIAPATFASIPDNPDNGVAFSQSRCTIYFATQHGIYSTAYTTGDQTALGVKQIAHVRTGEVAPNSDGDVHSTSSVAFSDMEQLLYAGVGSSCNACVEVDPTRATVQQMTPTGGSMHTRATRYRNAIGLAVDPVNGHLWAGGAGQDSLPTWHPYEFADDVSSRTGVADYGWPECEENHRAYAPGANCASVVIPLIAFPAYTTIIGMTFYPLQPSGKYAFPASYAGGLFITRHGSWHTPNGCTVAPEVDFVPMRNGVAPASAVNWSNPTTQYRPFVTGFQPGCPASSRIGRPTGIAVSPDGSLFIADDQTGNIYRVRP